MFTSPPASTMTPCEASSGPLRLILLLLELPGSASWKSCCRKSTVSPRLPGVTCTWECGKKRLKHWKKDTECGTPILFSGSPFMRSSTRCAQTRAFKECSTALVFRDSPACLRASPICKNACHYPVCLPHAIVQGIGTSSEWPNHRCRRCPVRCRRSSCQRTYSRSGDWVRGPFREQRRWHLHYP